jgi:hypothetical protein
MGLHHLNSPLKIRGQVLPSGSAGVMIFLYFQLLHFFLDSAVSKLPVVLRPSYAIGKLEQVGQHR